MEAHESVELVAGDRNPYRPPIYKRENMIGTRTNMVSIFPDNPKFYRDENRDLYIRCDCGYNEILRKNAENINDEIAAEMRAAAANHNCAFVKAA